jgi:glucosyl-dolichyl phosphate glucuronosyltransferase
MSTFANGISIVVPTRNRSDSLKRTLESVTFLNDQLVPLELIIVDNSAASSTLFGLVAEFRRTYHGKVQIRVLEEKTPGLLSGRHRGLKEAKGDIIAYIDDDIVFTSNWLEGIVSAFSNADVALCGGPTTPLFLAHPPDWLNSFWCKPYRLLNILPELSLSTANYPCILEIDPQFIFGLNFIIRKNVLLAAGGFHPDCVPGEYQHFQGDGETGLGKKIQQLGLKAIYHHEVHLHHQVEANRLTVEYFENRYFYQGVCDSYTSIRKEGHPSKATNNDFQINRPSLLRRAFRRVRSLSRRHPSISQPNEETIVKGRCQSAYKRGFEFHQECARRSRRLREWITRPDYFDYSYPTLEEDYISPMREPTLS